MVCGTFVNAIVVVLLCVCCRSVVAVKAHWNEVVCTLQHIHLTFRTCIAIVQGTRYPTDPTTREDNPKDPKDLLIPCAVVVILDEGNCCSKEDPDETS